MQKGYLALQGERGGQTLGIKWREDETQKRWEMGLLIEYEVHGMKVTSDWSRTNLHL